MIINKCNICGCNNADIIWVEPTGDIVKCSKCAFIYSRERPQSIFERAETPAQLFDKTSSEKWRVYEQILKLSRSKAGGNLLDVGCRCGNFLLLANDKGYKGEGIEPSKKFADYARKKGLAIHNTKLDEVSFPDRSFDIITYLEVLEHIPSPREELIEAYRILKDDGILILELPNISFQLVKARLARLFGISGQGLMPDNHVVHFSERTCEVLLNLTGFRVLEVQIREVGGSFRFSRPLLYLMRLHKNLAVLARKVLGINFGNAFVVTARKAADCESDIR